MDTKVKPCIYVLIEPRYGHPRYGEVRYVGQTIVGAKRRLSKHLGDARTTYRNQPSQDWLRALLRNGLKPTLSILQEFEDRKDLDSAEIYWIAYFKSIGCELKNASLGGKTSPMTEETKRKLSLAKKGKRVSQETRAKLSKVLKGIPKSFRTQKHKDNISLYYKKNPRNYESKLKFAKSKNSKPFMDQFGNVYHIIHEAARELGLSATSVCAVLKGRQKSTKDYTFTYLEERPNQ